MSTQNTETLNLYKNTKLYNGSRYQYLMTGRTGLTVNQTFEQYLGTPGYTKTVYYKSINEPITINESIKDCDQYTYGSITNDSKTYYFFVDSITTDAYQQTTINYTIDWWSTNWANITCTKAHITRQNVAKPTYMVQPISDFAQTITQSSLTNDFTIWATYIPSGEGVESFISYIILEGNKKNINNVELGSWVNSLGVAGSDIKDCFIVPLYTYNTFTTSEQYYAVCSAKYKGKTNVPDETEKDRILMAMIENFNGTYSPTYHSNIYDTTTGKYWLVVTESGTGTEPPYTIEELGLYPSNNMLVEYITESNNTGIVNKFKMFHLQKATSTMQTRQYQLALVSTPFTSTEKEKQGIMDWNGNSIWEAPIGYTNISFNTRLILGISHIMIEFLPVSNSNNSEMLIGKSFCYDCRHPGLFVDSYQEYVMKNRDYDVNMRHIQSSKQETQAWVSTAENIGFGFAFGSVAGGAASGIGGVIESVGTTLINRVYDPQIQSQYDLKYGRMTDQISLVGDSITDVLFAIDNSTGLLKKYSISVSTGASTRYDNDINTNGYYSDEVTSTLGTTYFKIGTVIQADNVVVEGACNVIGKQQVVNRLQNGVEFI